MGRSAGGGLLVLLAAGVAAGQADYSQGVHHALPELVPVSSTYGSVDPKATAEWMVTYLGATQITPNITDGAAAGGDNCGEVAWVRMPESNYEFHFVRNPAKPSGDSLDVEGYVSYVEQLYGNLSEVTPSTYDKYMDFHVGMSVGNLTTIFYSLYDRNQPFFMVGADSGETAYYDLFVEIPGTGAILEFSSLACELPPGYTIELWDICAKRAREAEALAAAAAGLTVGAFGSCDCDGCTDTSVCYRKTTYASVAPEVGSAFSIFGLGAHWVRQGHPGINLQRCALIAWSEFDCGYQMHFVNGLSYPEGPMPLEEYIGIVEDARELDSNVYDQWLDTHMSLWVEDLQPFADLYSELGVPYILRQWPDGEMTALLVSIPRNGVAVELLAPAAPAGVAVEKWDLCADH